MGTLVDSLEQDRGAIQGVAERMNQMEDRIRGLSSVSEVLNLPLNPFVGEPPAARVHDAVAGASGPGPASPAPAPPPPARGAPAMPLAAPSNGAGLPAGFAAPHGPDHGNGHGPGEPAGPRTAPPAPVASPAPTLAWAGERALPRWLVLMHWVDFLLDQAGSAGVVELAEFYRRAGWVDGPTADQMLHYCAGLARGAEVSAGQPAGGPKEALALHLRSLQFIQLMEGGGPGGPDVVRLLHEVARLRGKG